MDYNFRKKIYDIDTKINEMVQMIYNFNHITGTNILTMNLNKNLNTIYKTYIKNILREKEDVYNIQMETYTDEKERIMAKKNFEDVCKFCDIILKNEYRWI